jgi:hypothetical protein
MDWDTGFKTTAKHSFLTPSKPHWINYDASRLEISYHNHKRIVDGTRLHELASECIKLKISLPNNTKSINAFVNDALGYRMLSEVLLFYSENAFGTTDAIFFSTESKVLRVHDLKTGTGAGNKNQLEVYAALFCLQYKYKPENLEIYLQIYQQDVITKWEPIPKDISRIMEVIRAHDKQITHLKSIYD